MSKNSNDPFSPGEKKPENSEFLVPFEEKERLTLETSETFTDKKATCREMAWSLRDNEKDCCTPHSVKNVECDVSETIYYLQDGQRYDEIDDSLYLGREDYLELLMCAEDAESAEEEEGPGDLDPQISDEEEGPPCSEATEFSGKEQSCEDSEMGVSLKEEEERMAERRKVFKDVLSCLNMDRNRKLQPDSVQQLFLDRGCQRTPEAPGDLAWSFLMKVQALDVTAGDADRRHDTLCEEGEGELPAGVKDRDVRDVHTLHPLDVLCASLLCSDSSVQRQVLAGMYQRQLAVPLLLPDVENNRSILMLGAMGDIVKEQAAWAFRGPAGETKQLLTLVKMPTISFVRLGDCSFSKSRILNTLLSPGQLKSRKVFFHRELADPGPPRRISDGLVEVAWCFPHSGRQKGDARFFPEPVAVANLRGDLERFWMQFGFLMEVSSAVFFFTDGLGEKELDLFMFLGEAAIERCYFVLSPQARESEEAQIVQRILKLKPSQLLFWEEEEAGEEGRNIKNLQAALQEVMSSSRRHVSVGDMSSLARELGIQVDQGFANLEGIQVPPSRSLAGTIADEEQQRHSQPESSSKSPAELPVEERGVGGEVSLVPQSAHPAPAVMPHRQNSCPFPVRVGGHVGAVPVRAPWVMGPHFGSRQTFKWFQPSPLQNSRVHNQGKSFGVRYFQPQRFCVGERLMKFPRPAWGHHMHGLLGRPPRPIYQHVQAWPRIPQTMAAGDSPAQGSHLPHVGSFGKSQPRQPHGRGTQPAEATGKVTRTTSHTVNPHSPGCQPAGVLQKPVRPAFQQGFQLKTQGRPLNPAVLVGSHLVSNHRLLPGSPLSQTKASQHKHPKPVPSAPKPTQTKPTQPQPAQAKSSPSKPTQTKPTQPQPAQAKPTQTKPTQPQPAQAKPTQTKPMQPQPTQAKPTQTKPTQPQPAQAKPTQTKPTQPQPRLPQPSQPRPGPRPTQPRSPYSSHSQAKAPCSRAGPKRGGKH